MRRDPRLALLLVLPGGILAVLVWGIATLVGDSLLPEGRFGLGLYAGFFARPDYVAALVRTVVVAGLTTAISLVLAYPVAYCIAGLRGRRDLVLFLVLLPWLVSLIVRTFGWIVLLGNRGLVNGVLLATGLAGSPAHLMFNSFGVLVGMVHVFCPFMILAILASFLHLDP